MNDAAVNYSSLWDIDQLFDQGEVDRIVLPANTTTEASVSIATVSLGYPPVIDGTFQVAGESVWRQIGDPTSSAGVNLNTFIAVTPTNVYFVYYNFNTSNVTVNVRFKIWTDKVTN